MVQIGDIVLPGDTLNDFQPHNGVIILGPGLRRHTDEYVVVTRTGGLCHKQPNVYWVDGLQKRYVPKKAELVVGIVVIKRGDILKVDIGSSEFASLSFYAFEGATKKLRPDLQVGDVVYARLLSANREMDPELVCVDSYYKAGRLGVLSNDGFVFNISQDLAHRLLSYEHPLLKTLGAIVPFEIVIGMNGKVWLNSRNNKDIDTIFTALLAAENQTDSEIISLCRK